MSKTGFGDERPTFLVPCNKLFLHRADLLRPAENGIDFQALVEDIKMHGIKIPLEVANHPMLAADEFHIISGKRRWNAGRMAGLDVLPCKQVSTVTMENAHEVLNQSIAANAKRGGITMKEQIEFVKRCQEINQRHNLEAQTMHSVPEHEWRKLKTEIDVLQWSIKAAYLVKCYNVLPQAIADVCGLPRSVVLDRLNVGQAISHDKAQVKVDKMNLEMELSILKNKLLKTTESTVMKSMIRPPHTCERCKSAYGGSTDGICEACRQREREQLDKGELVKCLDHGCKGWIKAQVELPFKATGYFCKKHQTVKTKNGHSLVRGISNIPLVDRDGDAIWVTRELDVIKVREMDEEHLTNALCFLIDSAKKRCMVTGIEESKWEEVASPRYRSLKVEATRRDEHLKCDCVDGVAGIKQVLDDDEVSTVDVQILCTKCSKGKDRLTVKQMAEKMASEQKKGRKLSVAMAMVAIITLITAGSIPAGAHVVTWFIDYLRAMGAVK